MGLFYNKIASKSGQVCKCCKIDQTVSEFRNKHSMSAELALAKHM